MHHEVVDLDLQAEDFAGSPRQAAFTNSCPGTGTGNTPPPKPLEPIGRQSNIELPYKPNNKTELQSHEVRGFCPGCREESPFLTPGAGCVTARLALPSLVFSVSHY
jgi:hypothetical protein